MEKIIEVNVTRNHVMTGSNVNSANICVVVGNYETELCDAIEDILSRENITVIKTPDGLDALTAIEKHKPQIAILDVALPRLYGFVVCQHVKNNPELADTKIVLMATLYDEKRYTRLPSSLYGADDYLDKHKLQKELVPKVYKLLNLKPGDIKNQPTGTQYRPTITPEQPQAPAEAQQTQPPVQRPAQGQSAAPTPQAQTPPAQQPVQPPVQRPAQEQSAAPTPQAQTPPAQQPVQPPVQRPAQEQSAAPTPQAQTPPAQQPVQPPVQRPAQTPAQPTTQAPPTQATPVNTTVSATPPTPAAKPQTKLSPLEKKARRLARIVLSDIVLYTDKDLSKAINDGTVYEILKTDLTDGIKYLKKKLPDNIPVESYLNEALDEFLSKKKGES